MENKTNMSNIVDSFPFMFEKDIGQHQEQVRFALRENNGTIFFTDNAYQKTLKGTMDAFLIKQNTRTSDLILKKYANNCKVCIGGKIHYTLSVANRGPDTATNIIVTDTLERGLEITSLKASMGTIVIQGNNVIWTIPELEIGLKAIATIEVTVLPLYYWTSRKCIENTAIMTSDSNLIHPINAMALVKTYIEHSCCDCNYDCD